MPPCGAERDVQAGLIHRLSSMMDMSCQRPSMGMPYAECTRRQKNCNSDAMRVCSSDARSPVATLSVPFIWSTAVSLLSMRLLSAMLIVCEWLNTSSSRLLESYMRLKVSPFCVDRMAI